ncbi:nucleotide sugar dehydrogenase [Haloarchaeobius litoreus]|uniref:UDP-N-acetyl-D-mannosamine dehydrogenase n=1 Tax=Haloarchaeobius litoreus TaxID=755306 RepID=A0ABD6DNH1_9EURY
MSETVPGTPYPPAGDERTFPWAFGLGEYPVAVYGLGKMGLPLAAVFAEETGNVVGVDIDEGVVAGIEAGESHVAGEPGLDDLVSKTVERGALRATTDGERAAESARIHVVMVPTLVTDGEPELGALDAAIEDIAAGLDPGDAVFVECTVPPRTCVDRVQPALVSESGLDPDEFGLAFCPERTMSGRAIEDIRGSYPKVVGGVDPASTELARRVYREVNDAGVHTVRDATTAEAVKVFEGLYRDVNIALANELAQFADAFGIDVTEAIETANTQPFCDIHTPGAGVGGHCIPYYPHFVMGEFEPDAPLLRTARAVNDRMPVFVAERLLDELRAVGTTPADATVAVLGLTYRPGVAEVRATPAKPLADRLADAGVTVLGVDPLVDYVPGFDHEVLDPYELYDRELDGAVLVTDHDVFSELDWGAFDRLAVVDGRQALDLAETDHSVYTVGGG